MDICPEITCRALVSKIWRQMQRWHYIGISFLNCLTNCKTDYCCHVKCQTSALHPVATVKVYRGASTNFVSWQRSSLLSRTREINLYKFHSELYTEESSREMISSHGSWVSFCILRNRILTASREFRPTWKCSVKYHPWCFDFSRRVAASKMEKTSRLVR